MMSLLSLKMSSSVATGGEGSASTLSRETKETTEDEKQAIVARWQELCGLVTEAGISEAEKKRRARAADEFTIASLHHMQAFADYASRRLCDDYPPWAVATEADRTMIFDRIMRPYKRRHN